MENLIAIDMLFEDKILNVPYRVCSCDAKEMSEYLKSSAKDLGINIEEYNSDLNKSYYRKAKEIDTPPIDIYEYQPFVFLKRKNGSVTLLDGFRRLLWYDAPNHHITSRLYYEEEMTEQQIYQLLLSLNHFKLYRGGGSYYDRGFALALKILFNVDILKFSSVFDSYLSYDKVEADYSRSRPDSYDKVNILKERIENPKFLEDMKFFQSLLGNNIMMNTEFATLIYKFREKHSDITFKSDFFIEKTKSNQLILDLQTKYQKYGNDSLGSREVDIINQLIPLYKNIIREMFGGKSEKTFAEKTEEVKLSVKEFKKNKKYTKLTGSQKVLYVEQVLKRRIINNKPIDFKCFVYPHSTKNDDFLKYGLLEEYEIKFLRFEKRGIRTEMIFGIKTDDFSAQVAHNSNGYYGYSKKYVKLSNHFGKHNIHNKIELFVDVTKEEIDEVDNNRNNWV